MLGSLVSLFVLLIHGNSPSVNTPVQGHNNGSGSNHSTHLGTAPVGMDGGIIVDGRTKP